MEEAEAVAEAIGACALVETSAKISDEEEAGVTCPTHLLRVA